MSDRMRWRYGDTNPVVAAVDSGTVIEIGDLVYQDVDDAKPASAIALEGRPELTGREHELLRQERFVDNFLGVAMQRSRSGDTDMVRVATTGVFEFDCPACQCELGDLFGVCGGDTWLLDQTVERVTEASRAIGRITKRSSSKVSSVLVDIRSTVMTGGVRCIDPTEVERG